MSKTQEQLLEEMIEILRGGGSGGYRGGNSAGSTTTPSGGGNLNGLLKNAKEAADNMNKLSTSFRLFPKAQREYNDTLYRNKRAFNDLEKALKDIEEGTLKVTTEQERQIRSAHKQAQSYEDSAHQAENFGLVMRNASSAIRTIGSQLIQGAIGITSAVQSGASGFGIAGEVLNAQAQVQNTVMQGISGAGTLAGTALMGAGGKAKLFGFALAGASQALGVYSDLLTQAVTGANRIIIGEGEKLLESYKSATAAGAILAQGADSMAASLKGSMYTIQDYSEMTKNNAELLSQANMGVGEASLKFGAVNKALGPTSKALVALGFDYKEQGAIMAQVMADMRKRDPKAELNDAVVAQRTKEYAVNLATLSNITGENARKLLEQSKAITGTQASQNFLAKLGEKGQQVQNAFAALPKQVQQDIAERAQLGFVANQTGRQMGLLNPAIDAMERELLAAAQSGRLDNKLAEQIQQKYATQISTMTRSNDTLAKIQSVDPSGSIGSTAQAMEDVTVWVNKFLGAQQARKNAEDQLADGEKDAQKGLTGTFLSMNEAGQEFRKKLQEMIIPKLGDFGSALGQVEQAMRKLLEHGGGTPWGGFLDWLKNNWLDLLLLPLASWATSALFKRGTSETVARGRGGEATNETAAKPGEESRPGAGKPAEGKPTVSNDVMARAKEIKASDSTGRMTSEEALKVAREELKSRPGFKQYAYNESQILKPGQAAGAPAAPNAANATPSDSFMSKLPKVPAGSTTAKGLEAAAKLTGGAARLAPWVAAGLLAYETAVEYGQIMDEYSKTGNAGRRNNRLRELAGGLTGTAVGATAGGAVGVGIAAGETFASGGIGGVVAPLIPLATSAGGGYAGNYIGRKSAQGYNYLFGDEEDPAKQKPKAPVTPTSTPIVPTSSIINPDSIKQMADASRSGAKSGVMAGFQVGMPSLTKSLADSTNYAMRQALNPAQQFLTQVVDLTNALQVKVADNGAKPADDSTEPNKFKELVDVNKQQAEYIRKLVEQNQTLMAFYAENQDHNSAQAGMTQSMLDALRIISRNIG